MRNLAGIIGLNLRYLVLTNSISSTDDNRPINLKKRYRYTYKPAILLNDDNTGVSNIVTSIMMLGIFLSILAMIFLDPF